jgi:hypothetical protein
MQTNVAITQYRMIRVVVSENIKVLEAKSEIDGVTVLYVVSCKNLGFVVCQVKRCGIGYVAMGQYVIPEGAGIRLSIPNTIDFGFDRRGTPILRAWYRRKPDEWTVLPGVERNHSEIPGNAIPRP